MDPSPEKPSPPSKIIFISRVDTFFGRILAQHLGHVASHLHDLDKLMNEDYSDLDFLHTEAKAGAFNVLGTWHPEEHTNPYRPMPHPPRVPAVHGLCRADDYMAISKIITAADVCIFPIVDEDGKNCVLEDTLKALKLVEPFLKKATGKKKVMILVSTLMTWAYSKQIPIPADLEPMENEVNRFGEEEFRRRKPHPTFRDHYQVEEEFINLCEGSKGILRHTIVGAGIIYGFGENNLRWMFKQAFQECQAVKIFDTTPKYIPLIYARDLCQIIHNICFMRPRNSYVFALDRNEATAEEIGAAISSALSNGAVEKVSADALLLRKTITALQYDTLMTDLRMDVSTVREHMKVKWSCPLGFIEAAPRIVEEFKKIHKLFPVKVAVIGMPFAGKTTLAKKLSSDYGLEYIDAEQVVRNAISDLEKRRDAVSEGVVDSKSQVKDLDPPPSSPEQDFQILLDAINASREKNAGQVSDAFVRRFVREALESVACQNHGFVLDGYPESYISARELFVSHLPSGDHKDDDKQLSVDSEVEATHNAAIMPDYVIQMDAPEEWLKKLVLSLPTELAPGGLPVEVMVAQRFAEYNFLNTEDDNVSVFYEECGISPVPHELYPDFHKGIENAITAIRKRIGKPRTYPLTPDVKLRMLRKEAERRVKEMNAEKQRKYFQDKLDKIKKERLERQWHEELQNLFREESAPTEPKKMAMRQYLMTYVLPVLTMGILSANAERPADPVDYLAEYILKNSIPLYSYESVPFTRMTAKANRQPVQEHSESPASPTGSPLPKTHA